MSSVVEQLRQERVILPAISTLESLVMKIRRQAEETIFGSLVIARQPLRASSPQFSGEPEKSVWANCLLLFACAAAV